MKITSILFMAISTIVTVLNEHRLHLSQDNVHEDPLPVLKATKKNIVRCQNGVSNILTKENKKASKM